MRQALLALAFGLPLHAAEIPTPKASSAESAALGAEAEAFIDSWMGKKDPAAAAEHVSSRLDDTSLIPASFEDAKPATRAEMKAGWIEYLRGLIPEGASVRTLDRILVTGEPAARCLSSLKRYGALSPLGGRLYSALVTNPEVAGGADSLGLAARLPAAIAEGLEPTAVLAAFKTGNARIACQPVVTYWAREASGWKLWGIELVPVM